MSNTTKVFDHHFQVNLGGQWVKVVDLLTAAQVEEERDALKARVSELEREAENKAKVITWIRQHCLGHHLEKEELAPAVMAALQESYEKGQNEAKARVSELEKEQEILVWNLAGCSTYAMGYDLTTGHNKEMARPALDDVLKLALRADEQRKRIAELEAKLADLQRKFVEQQRDLQDWKRLLSWGGTPAHVEAFIKGQQDRIHAAQLEAAKLARYEGAEEVTGIEKADLAEFWDINGHAEGCAQVEARISLHQGDRVLVLRANNNS